MISISSQLAWIEKRSENFGVEELKARKSATGMGKISNKRSGAASRGILARFHTDWTT
jgi:hypothetical protein